MLNLKLPSFKQAFNCLLSLFTTRRPVHFLVVIAALSFFFAFISNLAFWHHVKAVLERSGFDLPLLFIISVPFALFFLMCAVMILLCSWKWLLKPVAVILLLTCATATYASLSYGIIFDGNMLTNFIETSVGEAASYISGSSLVAFTLLGIIPAALLLRLKIYYPGFFKTQIWRAGALAACLGLAALCIFPFYQQYSFLGRDNKNMNKEILPVSYVYSAGRYALSFFDEECPYVALGEGAYAQKSERPRLMFLILGETARAANFSALGYPRPTNQYSDKEKVINYANVRSCGTATAFSVPCMFSNLKREDYSPKLVENREGALDVIKKAGYDVLWLDNDDGCKAVCDRVKSAQISPADSTYCDGTFCYDGVFIDYAKRLTENLKKDTVIAFHFIGSHGPRYYERYPDDFRVFTPDCRRPDVEKCSREEVINAYDNSVLYTDHVIYELIEVLESRMDKVDPMLMYISDHGESLGENGIYLHAAPYAAAPDEQTTIPLQLWLPDQTAKTVKIDKKCLRSHALAGGYSHDNFFHSLLGLLQITAPEYEPGMDIFNVCREEPEVSAAPLARR